MKLSMDFYEYSERFGDYKGAEMVKEAGFDAIDYSFFYMKEKQEVLGENYREYAQTFRAHLDAIGLECNQAHAPFGYEYGMEGAEEEKHFTFLARSIEAASILGAKIIVVHAIRTPRGVDFDAFNLEFYNRLLPICEKFGILLGVENLFNTDRRRNCYFHQRFGKADHLNRFMEMLNSPWAVVCVDLGHAALTGNEPQEFIEDIKPQYLKALHVHDNDYLKDRHRLPYLGEMDWDAIIKALKKSGYQGDLTMELISMEFPSYAQRLPDALIPAALRFAAEVGRHLIEEFEKEE